MVALCGRVVMLLADGFDGTNIGRRLGLVLKVFGCFNRNLNTDIIFFVRLCVRMPIENEHYCRAFRQENETIFRIKSIVYVTNKHLYMQLV